MAYIVMAYIVISLGVSPSAYIVMAYIVMALVVSPSAYIVMAYIVISLGVSPSACTEGGRIRTRADTGSMASHRDSTMHEYLWAQGIHL